jgi:hypothetical protein
LISRNVIRVASVAIVLTTLSFAAGVAGDLSAPPSSGERVVVRIPPEEPAEVVPTAALAPLTPSASAAEVLRPPRQLRDEPAPPSAPEVVLAAAKPASQWTTSEAKPDLDRAPKPENA